MGLTEPIKALLREAARGRTGSARRRFLARSVAELGPGGQRRAARELGWSRVTSREGQRELASGFACVDAFALRGRTRAEVHRPHLLADLEAIVCGQRQADPCCRTTRRDTRLTAGEVRRQRIARRGHTDAALPCVRTIGAQLKAPGDYPQTVVQRQPRERSPKPTPSSPR